VKFPGVVFNTYFRYNKAGKSSYKSVCDQTMIGWYRSSDASNYEDWGCFFAEKIEKLDEEQVEDDTSDDVKVVQPYQSFLEKPAMYEDNASLVDKINS
jgi:hypothetical protein